MKRSERNLRAFFFACRPWEGSRAFVVSAAFGAGFLSAKCPGEFSSGHFLLCGVVCGPKCGGEARIFGFRQYAENWPKTLAGKKTRYILKNNRGGGGKIRIKWARFPKQTPTKKVKIGGKKPCEKRVSGSSARPSRRV